MLKLCEPVISSHIAKILNYCFQHSVFPDCFKLSKVVALYKDGSVDEVSNYRPISLTTSLSKVFERLIYNRLVEFFEKYGILSSAQFGFRRGSSTIDAISVLVDKIQTSFL